VGILASLKKLFSSGPPKDKAQAKLPRIQIEKRFELIGRMGQGSMSKVWRARDRKTGKMVCVKVLDKIKTERFEARFLGLKKPSEGHILTALKHPNIVTTYEHGLTTKGEQYLVMELIEGVGLNFLIETKSPQLEGRRVDILAQMAEALEYLHKKGFIHRDICPRNVMVDREGVVKLIDFGLTIPYTPDFCKPGNRTGTLDYLAPEVIKRAATDHRVDLFALGVTAYEMFTGQLPWEKAESYQVLLNHMNSPARDPADVKPDMDPRIRRFLIKAVQRDPKDRFQSAAEFQKALKMLPKM
jgi:serine/threonine protein kinase